MSTILSHPRCLLLIIGWGLFVAVAYKASQVEIDYTEFDPYQELGIDRVRLITVKSVGLGRLLSDCRKQLGYHCSFADCDYRKII